MRRRFLRSCDCLLLPLTLRGSTSVLECCSPPPAKLHPLRLRFLESRPSTRKVSEPPTKGVKNLYVAETWMTTVHQSFECTAVNPNGWLADRGLLLLSTLQTVHVHTSTSTDGLFVGLILYGHGTLKAFAHQHKEEQSP